MGSSAPSSFLRGIFGRDSSCRPPGTDNDGGCYQGTGVTLLAGAGFDTMMVDPFPQFIDAMSAQGLRSIVWMGGWDKTGCRFYMDDATFAATVDAFVRDPAGAAGHVAAYYLADEPWLSKCPQAPEAFAARTRVLHQHDPAGKAFVLVQAYENGLFGATYYARWMGAADLIGFDLYPCHFANGSSVGIEPGQKVRQACDFGGVTDRDIGYIESDHFGDGSRTCSYPSLGGSGPCTAYLAVLQDFQDCYYELPRPADLRAQAQHWTTLARHLSGVLVFSSDFYGNPCQPSSGPVSMGVRIDDCRPAPSAPGTGADCSGNLAELRYDNCTYFHLSCAGIPAATRP